ncbi:methyltransferase [Antrihabitans spumae]|uniref:Methyltransferase n=1 Tax=Antrihabitans spumae TaxID=3373370 RepID=A0ABW7KY97_9NOCA
MNEVEFYIGEKIVEKYDSDTMRPQVFHLAGLDWDLVEDVFPPYYAPGADVFSEWLPFSEFSSFFEMGCGVGIVAVKAALAGCPRVYAVDITPAAVANTKLNVERHDVTTQVSVKQSDLFAAIDQSEKFGAIFWNMPFLDCPDDTPAKSGIHRALFDPGYALLKRFLYEAVEHLDNDGRIFISFSDALGTRPTLDAAAEVAGLVARTYRSLDIAAPPEALADRFAENEDQDSGADAMTRSFDLQLIELLRR